MDIDINKFLEILKYFENKNYLFINRDLKLAIKTSINLLFPNINQDDFKILNLFSENLIEKISLSLHFKKEDKYYNQWIQNNYRDIKGIILLLLPFIDDKNNGKLLNEMIDLNQFLYSKLNNNISNSILKEDRNNLLKSDFKFGNMSLGLLNYNKDNLLDLFESDGKMKLIYKIIHHNYIGILKTIEIMNGKYYINWINIVPLLLEDYQTSELYIKTKEGLEKYKNLLISNNDSIHKFSEDYYGLWFGDIYNVIKNKLYDDIKQIKFLIFSYRRENNPIYIIQYLNEIINVDLFFKFENYVDLDDKDKYIFQKSIQAQLIEIRSNTFLYDNVWKQIILFLCNNYSKKTIIEIEIPIDYNKFSFVPELTQLDFSDETEQTEEYSKAVRDKIQNLVPDDIINFLKNINIKHIWNFLQESFKKLEGTFLKEYLIINKDNKITISDIYEFPDTEISLKNIYNIAKSITHFTTKGREWISLDSHYISFDEEYQIEFFKRFLGLENTWLNLSNNVRREYGPTINITTKTNKIMEDWNKIKLDLIFKILIKNGLLNKFDVDLEITDKKKYFTSNISKEIQKRLGKKLKKNSNFKKAYYYLTNDTFENLPKIRFEDSDTKKKPELHYFDLLEKDQSWYSFYALDWLSQINFFHHYINHRVLYVTGATGQGKSTQVPKLLLYASKVYDYKNNGKVICTQPRIPPTIGNSERISMELGLPISVIASNSNFKVKTNNFYVQMKHSNDSHLKNNCPHPTLKILTDGTLYEELIQNPLMKESVFSPGKKDFVYGLNNHYDSIIIDESHEHNTNMDMILTLLRQSCFYNNALRLIVMSATMDEDEPIYRSYFRCINDNLLYPIKAPLYQHPIIKIDGFNNKILPDTIFMDRRFHISPPGETTQYVVTEDYYDNDLYDKMNDKPGSIKIQEMSYKKIVEICSKYPTGEILLFLTGQGEISKAVEELNKILPAGNIALPYFSSLNETYKDIIQGIDKKISRIRNKREKIAEEWGPDFIEDLSVPEGIYQRAIIIATNVAEASVTIPRLKFVVDTGYAKVNIYDLTRRMTLLQVEKISEASRVQRKGRVGRLSDGTVYFLYPKGAREKILPKYKITQEDPSPIFLKLSINDGDNFQSIIPSNFNPNYFKTGSFYNIKANTKGKDNFFKKNIYNILRKQYSINANIINKDLYWNEKYFPDDILVINSLDRSDSGQLLDTLVDDKGQFYIIHPFENDITRNIKNEIIEYKKIEYTHIPKNIYKNFFTLLKNQLVLLDKNAGEEIEFEKLVKTEIYQKVLDLQKALSSNDIDTNDCLTIFAASGLNCFNEVLAILIGIKKNILQIPDLASLSFKPAEERHRIEKFISKWIINVNSELLILYNIYKNLKSNLNNLLLFKIIDNPLELNKYVDKIQELIRKFKIEIKKISTDIPFSFKDNSNDWNLLKKLYNSGNLENSKGLEELKFIIIKSEIEKDLLKHILKIKEWCNLNYFTYENIITYLNAFAEIILNVLTIERNLDIDLLEISPLKWMNDLKSSFIKILKNGDMNERIIKSFIIGRPINYAIKLKTQDNFYHLSIPNIYGEMNLMCSSNFIFYYNYTEDTKKRNSVVKMNYITNVTIDDLTSCNPQIFNKLNFKNNIPIKVLDKNFNEETKVINLKTYTYDTVINNILNTTKFISPWESLNLPSLSEYFKNLRKKLAI